MNIKNGQLVSYYGKKTYRVVAGLARKKSPKIKVPDYKGARTILTTRGDMMK